MTAVDAATAMTVRASSDAELVEAAGRGEPCAYGELFRRWYDRSYDVALTILRDREAAAAVAQEVMLAARAGLADPRGRNDFGGRALRATRQRALTRVPEDRFRVLEPIEADQEGQGMGDPYADTARQAQDSASHRLIWSVVAVLGERDTSLLDLHLRHGLTSTELTDDLQADQDDAANRLFQLRRNLRDAVGAVLLWHDGRPTCTALATLVPDSAPFDGGTAATIRSHQRSCEECQKEVSRQPSAERLFAAVPVAVAPLMLKERAAAALARMGAAMAPAGTPAREATGGETPTAAIPFVSAGTGSPAWPGTGSPRTAAAFPATFPATVPAAGAAGIGAVPAGHPAGHPARIAGFAAARPAPLGPAPWGAPFAAGPEFGSDAYAQLGPAPWGAPFAAPAPRLRTARLIVGVAAAVVGLIVVVAAAVAVWPMGRLLSTAASGAWPGAAGSHAGPGSAGREQARGTATTPSGDATGAPAATAPGAGRPGSAKGAGKGTAKGTVKGAGKGGVPPTVARGGTTRGTSSSPPVYRPGTTGSAQPPAGATAPPSAPASPFCTYAYQTGTDDQGNPSGSITISNLSSKAWTGWTATYSVDPAAPAVTGAGGSFRVSGASITFTPSSALDQVPPDSWVMFSFETPWSPLPAVNGLSVQGHRCQRA